MRVFIALLLPLVFAATPLKYDLPDRASLEYIAKANVTNIVFENYSDRLGTTKFAYNLDIDNGVTEVIKANGGATVPVFTAASLLTVVSSDANDTSSGTGAQSIYITGLDSNYDIMSELVTMNGAGSVSTTSRFIAVNRAVVYIGGTNRTNAGNITITHVTDNAVIAYIPAGVSVTQQSIYTVPNNYMGYLQHIDLNSAKPSGGSEPEVTFTMRVYSKTQNVIYSILRDTTSSTIKQTSYDVVKLEPIRAKETIWIEAVSNTDNTQVSARYSIILGKQTLP